MVAGAAAAVTVWVTVAVVVLVAVVVFGLLVTVSVAVLVEVAVVVLGATSVAPSLPAHPASSMTAAAAAPIFMIMVFRSPRPVLARSFGLARLIYACSSMSPEATRDGSQSTTQAAESP